MEDEACQSDHLEPVQLSTQEQLLSFDRRQNLVNALHDKLFELLRRELQHPQSRSFVFDLQNRVNQQA